jgi:hypothetical protein
MVEPVASSIRAKGDKNKMAVSALALRSADYEGRETPSGRYAWGVFMAIKTHLATLKLPPLSESLHPCILG